TLLIINLLMDIYVDMLPLDILNIISIYLNSITLKTLIKLNNKYLNIDWNYLVKLIYPKDYKNIIKRLTDNNFVTYQKYILLISAHNIKKELKITDDVIMLSFVDQL